MPRMIDIGDGQVRLATPEEEAEFDAIANEGAARAAAEAALAYRRDRAVDYIRELGHETGDRASFEKTVGDIFDLALAQIEAIRQAVGAPAVPGWTGKLELIAEIKGRHPQPAEGGS